MKIKPNLKSALRVAGMYFFTVSAVAIASSILGFILWNTLYPRTDGMAQLLTSIPVQILVLLGGGILWLSGNLLKPVNSNKPLEHTIVGLLLSVQSVSTLINVTYYFIFRYLPLIAMKNTNAGEFFKAVVVGEVPKLILGAAQLIFGLLLFFKWVGQDITSQQEGSN